MSKKIIYMVTVFLWLFTSLTVSAQTLSAGMTGQEVKELQKSLAEAGYLARTADGDYGSTTKKAVTEFQKDHGLIVTGTADDKTQAEIKKAKSGKRRKGGGIVYAKGNRGNMIADLQNKLRAAGYLKDQTDGVYGNATEAAVKKLQKDYNLP